MKSKVEADNGMKMIEEEYQVNIKELRRTFELAGAAET
jgi:hypothetical protein